MNKAILIILFIVLKFYQSGYNQVTLKPSLPIDTCFFPYSFINDDKSARYTYYRAEGDNTTGLFFHSIKYLRKYKNKKTSTNSSEIKYFQNQTFILDWLYKNHEYKTPENSVKIGLVGDLMWIRNNWNFFVDQTVLNEMQKSDFWIGNLETVIDKNKKVKSFFPDYFKYNADTGLVTSFYNKDSTSLFKVVSIANNHVFDAGENGLRATMAFLNEHHILSSGIKKEKNEKSYVTFLANNIKFGFYAACWGINNKDKLVNNKYNLNILKGIAPIGKGQADLSEIRKVLKDMEEEGVDFKIISLHWGAEYEMYPDPQQVVIAREIVESGADLILGSHPHVIQPFEVYFLNGYELKFKNDSGFFNNSNHFLPVKLKDNSNKARKALVLYSLGNFTTEMFTELCQTGIMFGISVFRNEDNLIDWDINKITYVINFKNGAPKRKHKLMLK